MNDKGTLNQCKPWQQWQQISWSVWIFVLTLVAVFIFVPGEYLRYDMSAIGDGEYWRLIGASFNHVSWLHLLLNLVGFVLLVLIFPGYFRGIAWLMRFLMIMLLTNLIILVIFTDSVIFTGLSGALHGFMYSLARAYIRQIQGQLLLLVLIVKLVLEQIYGDALTTGLLGDSSVFYDSHLIGVFASILVTLMERYTRANKPR